MRYPARGGWSAGAVAVAARAGRAVVQVCASGPRVRGRQVAWWPAAWAERLVANGNLGCTRRPAAGRRVL